MAKSVVAMSLAGVAGDSASESEAEAGLSELSSPAMPPPPLPSSSAHATRAASVTGSMAADSVAAMMASMNVCCLICKCKPQDRRLLS